MEKPDTITVTVAHQEEIQADKADIHITIKGSSLFTGTAALKKAQEISQLVSALHEHGVKDDDISLLNVHAESASGIFGRSSGATYHLRIRCHDLNLLADLLGAITSQKSAKLSYLNWRYPDEKKIRSETLLSCLAESRSKARDIASGLGLRLLGVHSLVEKWADSESEQPTFLAETTAGFARRSSMRSLPLDLGFPLSHSKRVDLVLQVDFRVSELKAP